MNQNNNDKTIIFSNEKLIKKAENKFNFSKPF